MQNLRSALSFSARFRLEQLPLDPKVRIAVSEPNALLAGGQKLASHSNSAHKTVR